MEVTGVNGKNEFNFSWKGRSYSARSKINFEKTISGFAGVVHGFNKIGLICVAVKITNGHATNYLTTNWNPFSLSLLLPVAIASRTLPRFSNRNGQSFFIMISPLAGSIVRWIKFQSKEQFCSSFMKFILLI